jgi:hypothetical protein
MVSLNHRKHKNQLIADGHYSLLVNGIMYEYLSQINRIPCGYSVIFYLTVKMAERVACSSAILFFLLTGCCAV